MITIMKEEKAVIVGHHGFFDIGYTEDVIDGDYLLMAHIYDLNTNECTDKRQFICNEWYQSFRDEAYKYEDSSEYCHNFKQLLKAFKEVI